MMKNTFKKKIIGNVEQWLVDEAKKIGLDIDGFTHEITSDFINHVMKNHGNENIEKARGQIAVKESDFEKIPELLSSPDHVIAGGKYTGGEFKGFNFIAYAKKMDDNTTLYYEAVINSKSNKSLRGKTLYKREKPVDERIFYDIVANTDKIDLSKAKTISLVSTGSYPGCTPITKEPAMEAIPIKAQGLSDLNISHSDEMSSINSENIEQQIKLAQKVGFVQGVCECVKIIGDDHALAKKLLTEMNVTKDMAKKFANPETYKELEKGIFAQKEQKLEQTQTQSQGVRR
jgi:hypothetical protein